ncbi:hypothetical protein ARAM_000112 [Aspergillus rambellii]|uniref:HMG box domain-containing protein n=1 Tax=Aspergillus rambellii TaxID=308745 RepID=A0A0F8XMY0_9EURO|nr:hypothetical protein ARAM_000112 [Aspergillus rambellii]
MTAVSIAMKSVTTSTDNLTELLWQDALRHLGATNNEVLLPTNVMDLIGQDNVDKIKSRLCVLLGAPVVAFVDESINVLRIMRTPVFSGSSISIASHDRMFGNKSNEASSKVRAASTKSTKIPRPPNAFILYRQHHHPRVKEAYPDLSNNQISIILGKQWKAESEEVKVHFKDLAEEFKKKHAEDHPDYQYTPRKPSEKKRRATSRRSPKHVKSSQDLKYPTPTSASPNAFTPTTYPDVQNGNIAITGYTDDLTDLNLMFDSSSVSERHSSFDSNAFDTLFQQPQDEYARATLYPHMNLAEQSFGDSFEFPNFPGDCF